MVLRSFTDIFTEWTTGNKRRGVCPNQILSAAGVNACYATNNVQNLFTFTGKLITENIFELT